MSPLRRVWVASILGIGLGAGNAAELKLPPLTGELTGDFTALKIEGLPTLHWKMAVRSAMADERAIDLTVEAENVRLRAELRLDAAGNGTWRLLESRLQAGPWLQPFIAAHFPKAANLVWAGTLVASGEGTRQGDKMAGKFQVELRGGSIRDAADTWAVSDVTLTGGFDLADFSSTEPLRLNFGEARGSGIAARNGIIEFTLDGQQVAHVSRAEFGLATGRVALSPFDMPLARPAVATAVDFSGVELDRLKMLLPPAVSDANGPVSGRMDVRWTLTDGLAFANGSLRPKANETATIRLAPQPGFLTHGIPERLSDKMPPWLGPLRKLFPARIPVYQTLSDVELGKVPLKLSTVEVQMNPQVAEGGKTIRIILITKPMARNGAVDTVRFEVRVSGPLADLVWLALNGQVSGHLR